MSSSEKHYTPAMRARLEKARMRMHAVATRKARQQVNIHFYADSADRARADAGCQLLHGVTFAMFCKQVWIECVGVTPRPPRRKKIEEMSTRELFFAQFPDNDREVVETVLAMSAHMDIGEMMTTDDIMDALEMETRERADYSAIGVVMRLLRWSRVRALRDGKRTWAYRKPANAIVPPTE